ncbi:REP-associated tyrosine transposase [Methylomonas methanica]|uniref:Transposase n=1 Tax=Methylomonas methanica TaxID=421 RepID=A0A177M9T1_METMH|nr:transposase [Methylomonas methanica]OAI02401.1 transposase [Methylomonas methanica]OAI04475.1 transposase [Methylomonas methanica]
MTEYRRHRVQGGTYFFTVNLADRNQTLLTDHIEVLRQSLRTVKQKHPFTIEAIVVLPEHLHAIWTLPDGDDDFSLRWRQIKSVFSRHFETGEKISNSRMLKNERGIWQRRFWEHRIKDDNDFARHVDYIHFNPVKHGHVATVAGWPYSSFHQFVYQGILPMDWGGVAGLESDLELE